MSVFSIDSSALEKIRRIFAQSDCRNPVARLYEKANAGGLFADLSAELISKRNVDDEFTTRAKDRLTSIEDKLESQLVVSPYERSNFQEDELQDASGITFVMNAGAAKLLTDCSLTFENGRFLLRDGDSKIFTLRSLARRAKGI